MGFYGCLAHQKRGSAVCGNRLTVRMERVNEPVLGTLAGDVLRRAVIDAVVAGVLDGLKPAARSGTWNVGERNSRTWSWPG